MNRILIIFVWLIVISCNHKAAKQKPNDIKHLKIEIKGSVKYLDISKYYDASFIALELTRESIIGNINKVIIYNELIFVLDAEKAKSLFVFNMEGKYLRTIGGKGKSEGEYLILSDFDIVNDRVYMSSLGDNKMLVYKLDGMHLKDIKFSGYIGTTFKALKEGGFIVENNDGSNKSAIFYDAFGKEIKKVSNSAINFMRYCNQQVFFSAKKSNYMFFALNDTIYKVDDSKLIPEIVVDFGSNKLCLDNITSKEKLSNYLQNSYYIKLINFYSFNKYFVFRVADDEYCYSGIYNKENEVCEYANRLTYKGFPVYEMVGVSKDGPVFLWGPSAIPCYRKIQRETSAFVPDDYQDDNPNANPGIVILSEK